MSRTSIITGIRDFWKDNITPLTELDINMSNEQLISIAWDLNKIAKNVGVFTESLSEEQSCSVIPETPLLNKESSMYKFYVKYITLVRSLLDICGVPMADIENSKKLYCSEYSLDTKENIIISLKSYLIKIFEDNDGFNKLIAEYEELDKI